MARSLKKGPFADAHLLKKVDALNAANKTEVMLFFNSGNNEGFSINPKSSDSFIIFYDTPVLTVSLL
jgi:hypothetical protein